MSPSSLERVLAHAQRMPFVALVTALERLSGARARLGSDGPHDQEPVVFRHDPAMIFHPSDVVSAKQVGSGRVEVMTAFLGLSGAASPMPLFFVEELAQLDDDDAIQRELLDIFHHRLLSLLFRGLVNLDITRSFEDEAGDPISRCLLLLAGILPERRQVTGLPTASLLRLSPLLIAHPKNAERLEIALRDVLRDILGGARVRVEQLTGGYARLDDASRCRLGVDARLGRNTTLGRRVRAPASRVRVALGPLPPAACARLSPGGDGEKKLVAVCELFAPAEIDVEVELLPTAALPARLGGQAPARLGRSWLRSRRRAAPMRFVASSTPRDDAEERLHAR